MQKEVFRSIRGYENRYEVSNLGRIRSLKRFSNKQLVKERILKTQLNRVQLYKDGKSEYINVSTLVYKSFGFRLLYYKLIKYICL